jgi:hypothetical protein
MTSPIKGPDNSESVSPLRTQLPSDSVLSAALPAVSQTDRPSKRRMVMLIDGSPEVHALVELHLSDLNADIYHAYSCSDGLLRLNEC